MKSRYNYALVYLKMLLIIFRFNFQIYEYLSHLALNGLNKKASLLNKRLVIGFILEVIIIR
ncbi:hypothetical protein VCRA2126O85_80100 [Vibrio crassostreae]|nr:hypothetical protein VCRA2113O322_10325 [Vibrio crassostreae]CAK1879287.1 hypothetical protein VCRA2113O326_10324 [Vibrio crassostreae]CAK2673157.1 hypothetical protein VCRA2113O321_10324 [Vibrio crassostreae]CAK2685841.1 hypothetical protein VCRA2113O323_10587 [Vibrio crassostreae]CAK2747645.1 hypothetical protein VCRA2113O325_10585 [Vibrio crassostreae]